MNEFDRWRAGYGTRKIDEEIAYHNDLEARFPDQAHYNLKAAFTAFNLTFPKNVVEAGAWKGDLAASVLAINAGIQSWRAYEISTAAIAKTVCEDIRFSYVLPERFDWFTSSAAFHNADLFLATHFIEHISDRHFARMAQAITAAQVPALYFEAPISDMGTTWEGYPGTHMLEMGWSEIERLFPAYEMQEIAPGCKLFTKK